MDLKKAIEILTYHQEWRLGKRDDMIHEPRKLTEAIDLLLTEVKKSNIANVSGSARIALGKTVCGGLYCNCTLPNRNTTSNICGTCNKMIAGNSV